MKSHNNIHPQILIEFQKVSNLDIDTEYCICWSFDRTNYASHWMKGQLWKNCKFLMDAKYYRFQFPYSQRMIDLLGKRPIIFELFRKNSRREIVGNIEFFLPNNLPSNFFTNFQYQFEVIDEKVEKNENDEKEMFFRFKYKNFGVVREEFYPFFKLFSPKYQFQVHQLKIFQYLKPEFVMGSIRRLSKSVCDLINKKYRVEIMKVRRPVNWEDFYNGVLKYIEIKRVRFYRFTGEGFLIQPEKNFMNLTNLEVLNCSRMWKCYRICEIINYLPNLELFIVDCTLYEPNARESMKLLDSVEMKENEKLAMLKLQGEWCIHPKIFQEFYTKIMNGCKNLRCVSIPSDVHGYFQRNKNFDKLLEERRTLNRWSPEILFYIDIYANERPPLYFILDGFLWSLSVNENEERDMFYCCLLLMDERFALKSSITIGHKSKSVNILMHKRSRNFYYTKKFLLEELVTIKTEKKKCNVDKDEDSDSDSSDSDSDSDNDEDEEEVNEKESPKSIDSEGFDSRSISSNSSNSSNNSSGGNNRGSNRYSGSRYDRYRRNSERYGGNEKRDDSKKRRRRLSQFSTKHFFPIKIKIKPKVLMSKSEFEANEKNEIEKLRGYKNICFNKEHRIEFEWRDLKKFDILFNRNREFHKDFRLCGTTWNLLVIRKPTRVWAFWIYNTQNPYLTITADVLFQCYNAGEDGKRVNRKEKECFFHKSRGFGACRIFVPSDKPVVSFSVTIKKIYTQHQWEDHKETELKMVKILIKRGSAHSIAGKVGKAEISIRKDMDHELVRFRLFGLLWSFLFYKTEGKLGRASFYIGRLFGGDCVIPMRYRVTLMNSVEEGEKFSVTSSIQMYHYRRDWGYSDITFPKINEKDQFFTFRIEFFVGEEIYSKSEYFFKCLKIARSLKEQDKEVKRIVVDLDNSYTTTQLKDLIYLCGIPFYAELWPQGYGNSEQVAFALSHIMKDFKINAKYTCRNLSNGMESSIKERSNEIIFNILGETDRKKKRWEFEISITIIDVVKILKIPKTARGMLGMDHQELYSPILIPSNNLDIFDEIGKLKDL